MAHSIFLAEYPLMEAFSKHGIQDGKLILQLYSKWLGDALLESEQSSHYIQDIIKETNSILHTNGKNGKLIFVTSAHNPLRIESSDDLSKLSIKIWTYNFGIAKNSKLFPWL